VAPRVGKLHCIDPSSAINVARRNLKHFENVEFHANGVDSIPVADGSMDFGYSLGVLHHVPETAAALKSCVEKLKPGAPFLVYLYYAFDNRPQWYKILWKASEIIRRMVSRLPYSLRFGISQLFAVALYWPLARLARMGEKIGLNTQSWPLTFYRHLSFYTMRTDALDRFGTRLEQRFSKAEIKSMMLGAGLNDIEFSTSMPYWCAVGIKS
jgi:SAM-dependent methyltransferase